MGSMVFHGFDSVLYIFWMVVLEQWNSGDVVRHTCTYTRFRGVAVITSALHAEGPQFDPGRKQFLNSFKAFQQSIDLI